ncbi:(2,3-dihydroxybenzoyl)adenylate synthase [Actinokineospora sp. G85]|uniref:(2,3-dihydroxybenzoyl)adenylate synthase n=1 Tax=Actinokineospora sp. G85 TaxID=3406626 RepID=UPI003C770A12
MLTGAPLDARVRSIDPLRAADYRARGLWRGETIAAFVRAGRLLDPTRVAVVDGDRRVTHGELDDLVARTAVRLRELGVRSADPVGVQLPNCLEYVVLVLALIELGAPPVLILPTFGERELDHVLTTAEPVALAVSGGRRGSLTAARALRTRHPRLRLLIAPGADLADEVDLVGLCGPGAGPRPEVPASTATPLDAAVFLLSSGTTGPPKVIARVHEGYEYMIRTALGLACVTASSVVLAVMPVEHGFVFNCPGVLGTLAVGGRVVLGSPVDPHQALRLIEQEGVTHSVLVPTLALQWMNAARERSYDLSSLRVVQVGGARLDPEPARRMRDELGVFPQQCYGMSEGLLNYTRPDDPREVAEGSQGRPASPDDEVLIVDENGVPVPTGVQGELLTRGPYTAAGYYRDDAATAAAFTDDGFYRTGDLVSADAQGNLTVHGRVRDAINRAGEKIAPGEVESLLAQHPSLRHAVVVAAPHELYGEIVCLFAVAEDGFDLVEARRFLAAEGLARYKLPERLELVEALPMIGIGKIDRAALRAEAAR